MRVHLKIKAKNKTIPFDHQSLLVGTIHKWLGWNEEHGKVSLYSFSRLEGGKAVKTGFRFEEEANFFFSAHNPDLLKRLIVGIQADPFLFHELVVSEIILQEDPDFAEKELFYNGSPIFIKRKTEKGIDHILFDDDRANECMKETLQTRMNVVGLVDDSLKIEFDKSYAKAGTKKITYNGIENKVSWCPVKIFGKPETKLFAWNVGLGNSTGIGFGAIK